jgi:hypothetical protein
MDQRITDFGRFRVSDLMFTAGRFLNLARPGRSPSYHGGPVWGNTRRFGAPEPTAAERRNRTISLGVNASLLSGLKGPFLVNAVGGAGRSKAEDHG